MIAAEEWESCPSLVKPNGVADIKCNKTKCKAVCNPGNVSMGKKAIKCKNGKWRGTLPECATCPSPTSMSLDSLLDFQARSNLSYNIVNEPLIMIFIMIEQSNPFLSVA